MGIAELASMIGSRFTTNVTTSFGNLSLQQWIRLIAIAGAYMLLRPYIIKFGGKAQMRQHEADEAEAIAEAEAEAAKGKGRPALSPNDLRGAHGVHAPDTTTVALPAESDDEDYEENATAATTATNWGANARKRQRRVLRKILAAHEQQLADAQADEEDKDIQEFLHD